MLAKPRLSGAFFMATVSKQQPTKKPEVFTSGP